ncbi:potassium efflux system protein [Youhaiella tibetensis]|uniref:monovalent cation:proton antiporter-2 (CPA2) family protein n=1 Tax=Paradevosia tibetensis TaxID=1447062 RepID=UPI000676C71C|nr:monovalent cation:proton antiporter-2 (CPA2) family protein [Youhaiella tibetensis]AKR56409.1 Glutathione-regulated potassium-efflux system protein KefB [Devosia sp. H5989]GGF14884.1 potassium efflux system protein [Youhaiella tibetensis]
MESATEHAAELAAHGGIDLVQVVILLAAGVIAVPVFRRLGLGSVLGYLAAGLVVGPFGLKIVSDPQAILHAAELGVVLFLFIIGLEMEPQRLWALRKQIFGLGVLQVLACGAILTVVGILLGFGPAVAFVFGMGFVLTSTAIVMQVLEERGELATEPGQKIVSILLLEDLAIVPLLAIVAIIAPTGEGGDFMSRFIGIGVALGTVIGLVAVGRWILNPVFKFLADAKAREVMTGAALLVVLGAAVVMEMGGLSMAMGAFLAGVLLSTSSFKHQLEADVEPFRGLLLGLFFLAVGMALDVSVVISNWQIIALSVVAFMLVKGAVIYLVARITKSGHAEALERSVMMAQGGEFAFVLYTTAASAGLISGPTNNIFTATVILSMVLTPFSLIALRYLMPKRQQSMEGVEQIPDGLHGQVLVIGFGRFGQIATQPLLVLKHRVSIIDNDTDMIRAASQLRFKVYYGDGTRLDILRAAGAGTADVIMICVDKKESATRIAELLRDEFPLARVYARAFDRGHAIELLNTGVEYQIRETFESALTFGSRVAQALGATADEAAEVIAGVRGRDAKRFELQQMGGGITAGRDLLISNAEEQAREGGVSTTGPDEAETGDREQV